MRRFKLDTPPNIPKRLDDLENRINWLDMGQSEVLRAYDDASPPALIGIATAIAEGPLMNITRLTTAPMPRFELAPYGYYDAVAISDGTGTHTTIQAAINELDNSGGTHVIWIGEAFTESVTIPAASGTHAWVFKARQPSGLQSTSDVRWTATSGNPLITTSGTTGILSGVRIENLTLVNNGDHVIQHDGDNVPWEFIDCYIIWTGAFAFFRANERCDIDIQHCYLQGEGGVNTPSIEDESAADGVQNLRITDSYLESSHFEIIEAADVLIDRTFIEGDGVDSVIGLVDQGLVKLSDTEIEVDDNRLFQIAASTPPMGTLASIRISTCRFSVGSSAVGLDLDNVEQVTIGSTTFHGSGTPQGTGLQIGASNASGIAQRISVIGNVFSGLVVGINQGSSTGTIDTGTIWTFPNVFENNTTNNDFGAAGDIFYSDANKAPAGLGIGSNGTVLQVASSLPSWVAITSLGLDHGSDLAGLLDDDHTQYALLAGRSGGQTIIGGTGSGDDLTLESTSDATKGDVATAAGTKFLLEADANFSIALLSSNPHFDFDSGDYFDFVRTSNNWRVVIGNVVRFVVNPNGRLLAAATGINGGILIGGDTQWYRSATNVFRTPDSVIIDGTLEVGTVQTYTETNVNADRSYDADSTTTDELADVLGTLIVDLRAIGLIN